MILLIDNYDSFVHNLARYLVRLGQETRVVRNDEMSVEAMRQLKPQAIVISPGMGLGLKHSRKPDCEPGDTL